VSLAAIIICKSDLPAFSRNLCNHFEPSTYALVSAAQDAV
jgi:hypothetical protein